MFTRFPNYMLLFDHNGSTFLQGIVTAMMNEKLNLYKKVEGIKLLQNIIKRFKGLDVESQGNFYGANADGILSGVNYILDGPQVDQKNETREIRAIRLKPILQFSKDYLLVLRQHVEANHNGQWNASTVASPLAITNFIKIMKSESVTALSNSPRVAKLIQEIRSIIEAITINPKDFNESQSSKSKPAKGKAVTSEKAVELNAAVQAKPAKGKAATSEKAEEPKAVVAAVAKPVKGKAVTSEKAEEPKAVVEAAAKPKAKGKGKEANIETVNEPIAPEVPVDTAVKSKTPKRKAAVTSEPVEEPKTKGKAAIDKSEDTEEPVEAKVSNSKSAKQIVKAKSPDVSSRTRSKKPKN